MKKNCEDCAKLRKLVIKNGKLVFEYGAEHAKVLNLQNENKKLHEENEKLRAELEQVKVERDAAVEQLHGICSACKNYSPYHNKGKCRFCIYEPARDKDAEVNDNWKWCGSKKEE